MNKWLKLTCVVMALFLLVFVTTLMFCVFGPLGGMAAFLLITATLTSFREERKIDEEEFIHYPARPYIRMGVQDHEASSDIEPESVRRQVDVDTAKRLHELRDVPGQQQ